MPIEYRIDYDRKIVVAKGRGKLTDRDVFGYQREVWSRADVKGYDEFVDMSDVDHITVPSSDRLQELAQLAAGMDSPDTASKFAIFATDELAYDLGRFFKIYRQLDPQSRKEVNIFRSRAEALDWLGVEGDLE